VFAQRDDDEIVVAYMARVLGIFALVSSVSVNARMEFVTQHFNDAIGIRRCMVLKTRP
jgi:hypothetical protein